MKVLYIMFCLEEMNEGRSSILMSEWGQTLISDYNFYAKLFQEGILITLITNQALTPIPTYQERTIIEIVEAIFEDKFVLLEDVGGEYEGHQDILDLRIKDSLEDALTSPYSPKRLKIKSWSGKIDREISVEMNP